MWDRENDLWAGHLTCDWLGVCSTHPSLYVGAGVNFGFYLVQGCRSGGVVKKRHHGTIRRGRLDGNLTREELRAHILAITVVSRWTS
jgi:hypothetical protein